MAQPRNPNDPYYADPASNDLHRSARLDQEMQSDASAMGENRVTGGRIAAAAVAIVVLIGALYYGMNMSATSPSSTASQTTPATKDSAQTTTPAVRDVTPNRDPGTTTGSAPAATQTPASPPSTTTTTTPSR